MFINKDADGKLAQSMTLRQKKIVQQLEMDIFKVVTITNILANAQIFKFCFIDKIKNASIDKNYEESCFVIQIYNHQQKNLVLTQSPAI